MERSTLQRVARRIRVPLGFVFAVVFLWVARPSWTSVGLSLLIVAPGVWLRGYAAGYVKKNQELTRTGPYAYTRNPLYLGSMLIALGFSVASRSWVVLAVLVVLFAVIYWPTILSEEAFLRNEFVGFDSYVKAVPRLLPRFGRVRSGPSAMFNIQQYLHHREYNAGMGSLAIYAALVSRLWMLRHQ